MPLVIVESPAKSKTIKKFLGPKFKVLSSFGHIRDLPENEFGVDVKNNYQPKYVVLDKAKKTINLLKKEVKKTDLCYLATDPDREGEAIAWHLIFLLGLNGEKPYQRIVFHEITKEAIKKALSQPRKIDMNLVNAQQARRILDRIVGYKLSPFLWKKVIRGLSAGRVQSVAVRLVVEREKEIEGFAPQEYWNIVATLMKNKGATESKKEEFEAILIKKDGKNIPKLGIRTKKEAEEIIKDLKDAQYRVEKIEKKNIKRNPLPPFITSTLQQEVWQRFKLPAKFTMQIAQQLYEAGLITYHRTDSLNLSDLALASAKKFIRENFGPDYYQFRKFKTKSKVAQEAHEAIRPTFVENTPEKISQKLNKNQLRIYDLIWRRFVACQMKPSILEVLRVEISAKNYSFQAKSQNLEFEGFLKIWPSKFKEEKLPPLKEGEVLKLLKLTPSQHFTQPPPRYTEASLIKELEKYGIGRPSTYATILSIIQERNYVKKDEKKCFRPTQIGKIVNEILVKHFPEIVDIGFTAKMEEDLDKVAQGKKNWIEVLDKFYKPFEKHLKQKYQEVSKKNLVEKTEKTCPRCGAPLVIRLGRFGKFYACSRYPRCDYTHPLEENKLGILCPKCSKGEIIKKRTKKGKIFYACSLWPKCDFATWEKPINKKCPKCGSLLVETKRGIQKCSNKECDFKQKI